MILKFIKNKEKYWEFIRILRTNPRVLHGFVNQNSITTEQQKSYMSKYGKLFYVCLLNEEPVGFIGLILGQIRIAILPEYQRKGIGSFMVRELLKRHPDACAPIRVDNEASLAFFKKLGFRMSFYILTPPSFRYIYENPLRL